MNKELMEKIAKTRLMKEFEKRPDDIAKVLESRGTKSVAAEMQKQRNDLKNLGFNVPEGPDLFQRNYIRGMLMQEVDSVNRHGKTLDDIKRETRAKHLENKARNNNTNPTPKLSQLGGWVKNNPGKSTAIAAAPVALATTAVLANKAYQKRKALRQREEANKTASFDYDEMVKMAYEDILDSFEK